MNFNGFVYPFLQSRFSPSCKMKSYLGKHSTDWHIFLNSMWYVAMRPELSDQDRKAIESALALQCAQPNFLLLVMPKGNNSSAARE